MTTMTPRRGLLRRMVGVAAGMLGLGVQPAVHAADPAYPQRPVRLMVSFGPGSGADAIARIVADGLADTLKTSVVVENREGAGGAIGTAAAARAPADGYTLMLGLSTMTVSPHMQATAGYDPVRDFVPIVKLAELPLLLVTSADAPYRSVAELVAEARRQPGRLTYATSGKGSPSHLSIALIQQATGIDVRDVPYRNVGQALTDVVTGQVSFYFPGVTGAVPHVKAGRMRALAIGATRRSTQLPDVPTLAEALGVQGLEVITWYGLFAPAGTPADVLERVQTAAAAMIANPSIRERIAKTGADIAVAPAPEFAREVQADNARYGKLIRSLGLREP